MYGAMLAYYCYSTACIVDGMRYENGSSLPSGDDEACVECSCKNGVSECGKRNDCEKSNMEVCSYGSKVADSGEKWVDGCLQCECLVSR